MELIPFFSYLRLSPDSFDPKGDIKFDDSKSKVMFRGNWPYYSPIKCQRYGLKVSKRFDNGSDEWLMMKNLPGEWPVAFHGIKNPNEPVNQAINRINSILSGLSRPDKHCITAGKRQAKEKNKCVNPPFKGQLVGEGVYLTPYVKTALVFTKEIAF